MAKKSANTKRPAAAKRARKVAAPKKTGNAKKRPAKTAGSKKRAPRKLVVSAAAVANAKKLERLDARSGRGAMKTLALGASSLRNSSFPQTYIQQVHVSLNDPNHSMILAWAGPDASTQETGPFHTSPGAGLRGLNCDNLATSQRSGTLCTPKGTFAVEGFASHLNSDARATFVTFFVTRRGIGLHYFPTVPQVAASHGCVRVQDLRIAQLIHDNARAGLTTVVVDGTWTKPPKQW